jgi:uncharacterized protein YuzE
MKIRYDTSIGAAYITLKDDVTVRATKSITDSVLIDLDTDGQVIGVELLSPGESIDVETNSGSFLSYMPR